MKIDIQIYNNNKQIFGRKNMRVEQSQEWLTTKATKLKDYTQIDIQMYTVDGMPVDDCSVDTYNKAHIFLDDCLMKVVNKEYKGVRYD